MKQSKKKLVLSFETVADLNPDKMEKVKGGYDTLVSCSCDECPTVNAPTCDPVRPFCFDD